jgi:hypothetical protein
MHLNCLSQNKETKLKYHLKACKMYKRILHKLYKEEQNDKNTSKLIALEPNIWACINRALNRKLKVTYDDSKNIRRSDSISTGFDFRNDNNLLTVPFSRRMSFMPKQTFK